MTGKQSIRFCRSPDGIRVAYATAGSGPPLVKVANYLTHLEFDRESPVWRHWIDGLSMHHELTRYDERGCGLSDWNVDDFSLEAWVTDLESVIEATGLERFPLLGISQGGAVAVAYAVRHPEKVTHLVLYGAYARGRLHRSSSSEHIREAETLLDLMRVGWGQDNPAFRQVFSTLFMPDATPDQLNWFNELQRRTTSPRNAVRFEEAFFSLDVTDIAPRVTTPTLVIHVREDAMVPFEEGRRLAALIPRSTFVPLEGRNHIMLEDEPAWTRFIQEMHAFIDEPLSGSRPVAAGPMATLSPREHEVLELIAGGLGNAEIAHRLHISPHTLRNHITNVFAKLQVETRAQAIVLAREAGLGRSEKGSERT
jgi:pimeloyl-ACP methyl ester carboxylesterase/DNA-binding CsgD family transcriptional regulator